MKKILIILAGLGLLVPLAWAAKASYIHTNFTAGELSPLMKGRVDVTKYDNGAEQVTNFIPTQFGSLVRTPGTEYIGEVRDSTEAARLIPFQFSTSQTYMLEFNDSYIRFFRNQARIVGSSVAISGITNADPGVVTAASHGLSNGDTTVITNVKGMTEVNGNEYKVAGKTANTFELTSPVTGADIDTTNYGTYEGDTASVLLLHLDSDFTDSSATGHTVTANGDAQITTAQKKFGAGSVVLDGTGDYLSAADHANWTLTGDFTIDTQVRFSAFGVTNQTIFNIGDDVGDRMILYFNDNTNYIELIVTTASSTTVSITGTWAWAPSANTWYHVELDRSGNNYHVFVDGTELGGSPVTDSDGPQDYDGGIQIGCRLDSGACGSYLTGYIDEPRVVKGTAEHTSNFTAPTSAYGSSGTLSSVYEIAQPYGSSDLAEIQYAQTADVMYLVHPEYAPRKLSRTGHTSWTLAAVSFIRGPFLAANETAVTITPDADTGDDITLTASAATFEADDVGALWKVKDGVVKIDTFTDTTHVDGDVQDEPDGTAGDLNTGPGATTDWAEGSWSEVQGYPGSVQFFEQRLSFAATTEQPQTIWLSVSEDYENFDVDDASAVDSMAYTIATEQVNAIHWLSAGKTLLMGTSGGVFSVSSGSDEDALTPANVLVKRETTYGSAGIVPKRIGNFTYYIQRDELTMRELSYSFEINAHKAVNISLLSEHITESGIKELDYQMSPHNLLWCVLDNGNVVTMTRELDQEVAAWAEQTTNGEYENVAVIQSAISTDGDEVWFIVNRDINGSTARYVELLKPFDWGDDEEDAFFVHSGLTYEGASTTTLTGLDHLEGESVKVWGGDEVSTATVSSGSITLDSAVTKAQAGLGYTSTLKTLPIEIGSQIGTAQGQMKRINNVIVRVKDTRSLNVGPIDATVDQDLDEFTTGDVEAHHDGGWDLEGQVEVNISDPVPAHILALIYQLTEHDR